MSAPFKELATPLNEYNMVCRGCLAASGEMKNMFEWGLHKEFAKYTDVQVLFHLINTPYRSIYFMSRDIITCLYIKLNKTALLQQSEPADCSSPGFNCQYNK